MPSNATIAAAFLVISAVCLAVALAVGSSVIVPAICLLLAGQVYAGQVVA